MWGDPPSVGFVAGDWIGDSEIDEEQLDPPRRRGENIGEGAIWCTGRTRGDNDEGSWAVRWTPWAGFKAGEGVPLSCCLQSIEQYRPLQGSWQMKQRSKSSSNIVSLSLDWSSATYFKCTGKHEETYRLEAAGAKRRSELRWGTTSAGTCVGRVRKVRYGGSYRMTVMFAMLFDALAAKREEETS